MYTPSAKGCRLWRKPIKVLRCANRSQYQDPMPAYANCVLNLLYWFQFSSIWLPLMDFSMLDLYFCLIRLYCLIRNRALPIMGTWSSHAQTPWYLICVMIYWPLMEMNLFFFVHLFSSILETSQKRERSNVVSQKTIPPQSIFILWTWKLSPMVIIKKRIETNRWEF